jgi:hypothetical protein
MTGPSNASHQDLDARYVAARRVLLDALTVLAPHGDAIILAGAQAVYLHTGTADLAIAPYTTDGDLVLDPLLLGAAPELEAGMSAAGFHLQQQPGGHVEPGIWLASASAAGEEFLVPVDLIVPEGAASGAGRRAARLSGHGARAARRAVGLEAALVDNSTMTIPALDPADERSLQVRVAGPAACSSQRLTSSTIASQAVARPGSRTRTPPMSCGSCRRRGRTRSRSRSTTSGRM